MYIAVFQEGKIRTNFIGPFSKQNKTKKKCELVNERCDDKKVHLIG